MAKSKFKADPRASECAGFHRFRNKENEAFGSFEVFWLPAGRDERGRFAAAGWFWVAGFPGCLPDSVSHGPFKTSAEAYDDAQQW